MQIKDLTPESETEIQQVAALLVEAFRRDWPDAWPTLEAALEEVRESFQEGRISRIMVDDHGRVLGWIGGIPTYDGNVWELHPLAVHPEYQGKGIGRALVEDFEGQARARGASTVMLGSDDETGMTTLSGVDLYAELWARVKNIRNLRRHPYGFYQKLGYSIIGVVPDANGPGKPDILMAKRIWQDA